MKKKLFAGILCFMMILFGGIFLSACGGSEAPPSTNEPGITQPEPSQPGPEKPEPEKPEPEKPEPVEDDFMPRVEESQFGTVQVIEGVDEYGEDCFYLKPIANNGYYFLKWEVKYEGGSSYYERFASILPVRKPRKIEENGGSVIISKIERVVPMFTNDSSLILFYELNGEVENNLKIEIDYLPYVNKENPRYSFYIHDAENLALESVKCYYREPGQNYVNEVSDGWPSVRFLPYYRESGLDQGFGNFYAIELKFKDLRTNLLIKYELITEEGTPLTGLNEIYKIYKIEDSVSLSPPRESDYYEFLYFKDAEGNVISDDNPLMVPLETRKLMLYAVYRKIN